MAGSSIDEILSNVEATFTKKLEVTSTIRSARSQAAAMYPHFETNSTTLQKYAAHKKPWLADIRAAYTTGKERHENKEAIVKRMTQVIAKQIAENRLISNHLSNSARDIRTRDFSASEIAGLKAILQLRNDLVVIDETKTSQPHIHIHLK